MPRKGLAEDPARVEALLKDNPEALRMFREATVAPLGANQHTEGSHNVTTLKPERGNSRAYTLDRLHRDAPALYAQALRENRLAA